MIQLYIARHGQTEENVRRILQGQMPGRLTPEGIQQAEAMKEELRLKHFDLIVTSDLKRAVDTTRIVSEPHGVEFEEEPLLRERDFGIYTGGPYLKISRDLDPSAETMEQVAQRAADFLNKIAERVEEKEKREEGGGKKDVSILAVSHGLFLRVLQAVFYGKDVREVEKMDNTEVRLLTLEPWQRFGPSQQSETGGRAN